ncbi:HEAT repeat domain-containing protein, partial [Streptomyces clavuligerus]
ARLLRDAPAPLVRRHAAAALAAVGGARAVDALTAALGDERITEAVAEIVARLPDPPVDRLLALLTGDGAAARRGAAVALGRLGCAEAAPALLAAVDGVDPAGVRAAVDALGALRYRPAVPYLAVLAADTGEPGTVRARAVRALGLIGAAGALPVVLAAARDPRGVVRARAAQALGAFAVPEAAEALGALAAGDADPDVARAAARALGRIGAPALPVLGGLAARPRPDGGPLMDDVVDALAECPGGAADAVLNRLVTDLPPGPARVRATGALSGRRVPEAVPALAALLLDDREYAGHADALRGLAAIGGEPATGHVLAYCRRFPERLETARGALGLLARRAPAS